MEDIKQRICEWASHVAGFDAIGSLANVIEDGIEKHHAKGLECEAAWRAIEDAVVAKIAEELHRMRVLLNSGDAMRDYVFSRIAELRGNCRRCGHGKREHAAADDGGCSGDFFDQLPKGPAHGRFTAAERSDLDALKRKAFEAAKPEGGGA